MQKVKRARPHDIIQLVARNVGADENDAAFKRAIHRDLKSLLETHEVGVDYFTPAGDPIPPGEEDKHANIRVEYRLLQQADTQIRGSQFFTDAGGSILASTEVKESIHFESNPKKIPKGSYHIAVEMGFGSFIHIWFNEDERPLKVVFARLSTQQNYNEIHKKFEAEKPKRTLILIVGNKSVSRLDEENWEGHGYLDFTRDLGKVALHDTGSSKGVRIAEETSLDSFSLTDLYVEDGTIESFEADLNWRDVVSENHLELPCHIQVGKLHTFVQKV